MSDAFEGPLFDFYAALPLQGPGTERETLAMLDRVRPALPPDSRIVDFGCGTGRSSLALARALSEASVLAVDAAPPFIRILQDRIAAEGLGERVEARVGDMAAPSLSPGSVDLVWSEAAAYSVGFENALRTWRPLLGDGGRCVVSECEWLTDSRPAEIAAFWEDGYPEMGDRAMNERRARDAGYDVLHRHVLSDEAWDDYYGAIDRTLADGWAETLGAATAAAFADEADLWRRSAGSYGYSFYVLAPR
jgi:serine/threonine-protein kinase HipA